MNKIKVACLFAGLEWHKWILMAATDGTMPTHKCALCSDEFWGVEPPPNPDPLHNKGDMRRLEVGMMEHGGWIDF